MQERHDVSAQETKDDILKLLQNSSNGFKVDEIRKECEIGSWSTTIKHALELYIDGQISGKKTSTGWIFWIEGEGK